MAESFYDQVRRKELEIAEGRSIPEFSVSGAQDNQEQQTAEQAGAQKLPLPETNEVPEQDQPTPEQQAQLQQTEQPNPVNIPFNQNQSFAKDTKVQDALSGQQDRPLARPLNIKPDEVINQTEPEAVTPGANQMPETGVSVKEMKQQVQGAVPDPDKPTYAPEQISRQQFDTETFANALKDARESEAVADFSFKKMQSANIENPVVSELASLAYSDGLGINVGDTEKLGVVPHRFGVSVNVGQKKEPSAEIDVPDPGEEGFVDPSKPSGETQTAKITGLEFVSEDAGTEPVERAGQREKQTPEEFLQSQTQNLRTADRLAPVQQTLNNPPAPIGNDVEEQQQRKSDIIGRFSASNIGRALGDGLQAMFRDKAEGNPFQRFGSSFSEEFNDRDFDQRGRAKETDETRQFLEPGLLSTGVQELFQTFSDEDATLGNLGERVLEQGEQSLENAKQQREEMVEEGINPFTAQTESLFRGALEVTGDLMEGRVKSPLSSISRINDLAKDDDGLFNQLGEEVRNSQSALSVLSQISEGLSPDAETEFDALGGKYGEFGVGTLGLINYGLNLPGNLVMAGVNNLWDNTFGEGKPGENPMEMALRGHDYFLTGGVTNQKTNKSAITPLASDPEDRNLFQWAGALAGDVFLGGGIDALVGGAIRGSKAMQYTENLAKQFDLTSAKAVEDIPVSPRRPGQNKANSGVSINEKLKTDPYLNNQPGRQQALDNANENPTAIQRPNRVSSNDTTPAPTPDKLGPRNITSEANVRSNNIDTIDGTTAIRKAVEVEAADVQPSTRIDYNARPRQTNDVPGNARLVRGGRYAYNDELDAAKQARRQLNASKRSTEGDRTSAVETTFPALAERTSKDARRLLRPAGAVEKVNTNNSLPNMENVLVKRDREQITQEAKAFGLVPRQRQEPLRPSEVRVLREDFGDVFNYAGRKTENSKLIQTSESEFATKLPSATTGEPGEFVKKIAPAQEEVPPEKVGDLELGLEQRVREMPEFKKENLRLNPVDEAQEQQVADFTKQLKNKLTRLRRESNSVPDNSEEAGQIINRVTKQARDYDALEAQAPSRAEARVEKDMFAPDEIKRGDEETFTEKVDAEREADDLMSDSRRQQEHQDAVEKVRESRAKQLEKFPEGLERQSIEEETANKTYAVEASRVVEPATPEEITQRQEIAKPQADELNTQTFYHGTQVDIAELDNGTNRIFSAIDPDAGGASTEMGVGVHLTSNPTIAENHAQALPPLNRPQLPDTKHLERGAVHQTTTDVQVPVRADVSTQDLPGDLGDVVRDVVKRVGEEHAPSSAFAKKFKRSIRKNRSFERYLDQFRRQLAEDGNISEQRVRAFQRDITRNLRLKGVDSVFAKRGEETVANVLFPERIRQVSSNYDLPEASTLSRKQARKFVDEQSDVNLQTTKANRIQSEFSLADELGQTHKQAHEDSAREALTRQQTANEKRSQLAEETKAQQKQEIEGAERSIEEEADDIVNRDWNPTNPTQGEAPTAEEAQREVERLIRADSQEDPNIDEDEVEEFLDEFGGLDPDSPERIDMQRIKNNFMECD